MKKSKLLIMPVVIMMAACNKQAPAGYSTTVDLPAGGEEVAYSESDAKAYDETLNLLTDGIFNSLNQSAIKLSLDVNATVKNIPVAEENKVDATISAGVDAYVVMPTVDSYASALIDVRDLTLTVSGIPEVGTVGIQGLKLKAYYRVETNAEDGTTTAKIYGDLSDPSVKTNLVPVLQSVIDAFVSPAYPDVQIDVEQMYDFFLKDGKVVYTLPEFKPSEDSEAAYPDPLGYYLTTGQSMLPFARSIITIDSSTIQSLSSVSSTLKVYKDNAGKANRVGLALEADALEIAKSMQPAELLDGEEGTEEVTVNVSIDDFDKIKVGAAIVSGNTTGSEEFALESLGVKADVAMKNGATAQGELNLGAFYGSQAAFTPLTDAEAAQYTVDINVLIQMIQSLIGASSQGGESR